MLCLKSWLSSLIRMACSVERSDHLKFFVYKVIIIIIVVVVVVVVCL